MLQAEIGATTAPCPKCRADMVLVVVTPHPIAPEMERHTYLCRPCNQTKTYVLPGSNRNPASDKRPRDIPW
jgi:C4-type Zn-finger protein